MPRRKLLHAGILFAALPWLAISCGTKTPTQPGLDESITAVPAPEQFLSSPQGEARELLLNGRPSAIEWNIAGEPAYVLLRGTEGSGGDFYLAVKSVWSYDARFGTPRAIYFLLQWPDRTENRLDHTIVNDSVDIFDDDGNLLVDCRAGNDALINPRNWHRSTIEEDQVVVEIFSTEQGFYPADNWRWGAGTTDPVFPSSTVEAPGALEDAYGQFTHPEAGFMEDRWDVGGGAVPDTGRKTYWPNYTEHPDGVVPIYIAGKGTRDTRLNRGKPVAYTVWWYVREDLTPCDSVNPIRLDDAQARDKTWNPGDYVPGWWHIFPDSSQIDVLARGTWNASKWNLEIRRDLTTYYKPAGGDSVGNQEDWIPWPDDLPLEPGRRYAIRITVYDASSTRGSRSAILPLYLKPRS